jgi:AcrR family transcriptional regulator
MRGNIPIPGSTKARLIDAGLRLFGQQGYAGVDVDTIAAEAGVTVGALYHHFSSKKNFYGLLRDDMTKRILDRMEAAAESVPAEQALKAALLAAYDGVIRIRAGKLLIEDDPREDGEDAIASFLSQLASASGRTTNQLFGVLLAVALRAALRATLAGTEGAREALASLCEGRSLQRTD